MTNPWRRLAKLSVKEIRLLQEEKLKYFLKYHIYPFSPFYQRLFDKNKIDPQQIRTLQDLRRIPFTSKLDFIDKEGASDRFYDFILQPDQDKVKRFWPKFQILNLALQARLKGMSGAAEAMEAEYRPHFITFTTGTTHRPVPFAYTPYDIVNLHLSGARMINVFNMKKSDRSVNFFPYAPHLAFWQVVFGGLSAGVLVLSTGGGKVMSSEANAATLIKMKPSVVFGVPSYIYHVIRLAKDMNYDLSFIKIIVLGAARVSNAFKIRLKDLLSEMGAKDVNIFGTYGFTEARSAWVECPTPLSESSGYHLYPDKEIFEIIDPDTGEVKAEGEDGELVYTSIDSRGSTVIRYRTGDFVKGGITYEPCPYCQRTVPRISSDITRLSDVTDLKLSKIKGTLVNLNHFTSVLGEFDQILEWQIEIRKKDNDPFEVDELVLYVCIQNGINKQSLADSVKKRIVAATEVTPNEIVFLSLDEIVKRLELETASKEKRIIDLRQK